MAVALCGLLPVILMPTLTITVGGVQPSFWVLDLTRLRFSLWYLFGGRYIQQLGLGRSRMISAH